MPMASPFHQHGSFVELINSTGVSAIPWMTDYNNAYKFFNNNLCLCVMLSVIYFMCGLSREPSF